MNKNFKKLDNEVYRIIENATDKKRAKQAYRYYVYGEGTVFSLLELGIAESIAKGDSKYYFTMREVFDWEVYSKDLGDLALVRFCIDTGYLTQFVIKKKDNTKGYKHLYVIQMSNRSVKIGIAVDTKRRFAQITSASGMKILKSWESELINDAHVIERKMHKIYKKDRLKGEYFNVNFEEAVNEAKKQIAMIGG